MVGPWEASLGSWPSFRALKASVTERRRRHPAGRRIAGGATPRPDREDSGIGAAPWLA